MSWIARSKLDLLRVSIDGATRETYAKYRVGGDFDLAMQFLAKLRDDRKQIGSALRVEWKYILFEWNDSDSEIQRAANLANELQVHLTFVRTHTPGRSTRFQTDEELHQQLRRLAPDSAVEPTFQLKSATAAAAPSAVVAEQVASLLALAVQRVRAADESYAIHALAEALRYDPGLSVSSEATIDEMIQSNFPQILADSQFPSTLTWLAALSREIGNRTAAEALLTRYLELVPGAPDRDHILCDRFAQIAVRHAELKQFESAHAALREAVNHASAIAPHSGTSENPVLLYMEKLLRMDCSPSLVAAFANVARAERQFSAARVLFLRYLEIHPDAVDRKHVEAIIAQLDEQIRQRAISSTFLDYLVGWVRRLFS